MIPVTKPTTSWRSLRTIATASVLASGLAINAASFATPRWATGETYHLTSSSSFHVDFAAGLWGYCRTATLDASSSSEGVFDDCFAFHSTFQHQQLSVCEAYARGFVYGTDDVRGIRLPSQATDDVHRIERPPTSLDDVHIERFIAKSCGSEGFATIALESTSLVLAAAALASVVWANLRPDKLSRRAMTSSLSAMPSAAVLALVNLVLWLHQSSDLRQRDDSSARVSIHLGRAVYMQLAMAALYALVGIAGRARDAPGRYGHILKR